MLCSGHEWRCEWSSSTCSRRLSRAQRSERRGARVRALALSQALSRNRSPSGRGHLSAQRVPPLVASAGPPRDVLPAAVLQTARATASRRIHPQQRAREASAATPRRRSHRSTAGNTDGQRRRQRPVRRQRAETCDVGRREGRRRQKGGAPENADARARGRGQKRPMHPVLCSLTQKQHRPNNRQRKDHEERRMHATSDRFHAKHRVRCSHSGEIGPSQLNVSVHHHRHC